MAELIFLIVCLGGATGLALNRAPLWAWAVAVAAATIAVKLGLASGELSWPGSGFLSFIGWIPAVVLGALSYEPFRRAALVQPVFKGIQKILPRISATEQEALDAGTVGWDAELFSGQPDWSKLKAVAPIVLTDEERAFLDGPTEDLCKMLDDWEIRHKERDIPEKVWNFVRAKGFLGMLISKDHGGLGFSPQAQSLILGKIASKSPDAVTIVMVPNSLGPGELIEKYGTPEQKEYYLPRLAQGKEIPCFALTGPTSGSDAATMRDVGFVCKGMHEGEETLGIKITWDKRYISLGPNATLLGLAFQLLDPDNLLGKGENIGITLALIPTDHPGVEIGRRHLPGGAAFPNGPNWGHDVFIPMSAVIGGVDRLGQGWRMLMSCLSAGRSISLPASSAAGIKSMLRATTAYARIRKQFGISIGRMEGIEEPLARIVEQAYVCEAGRAVTASMVAGGEKPAVISALLKYQSTERMRQCVNDAMDIHGGKAICDGPSNYIQGAYQMVPVGITVEGANILTRTLITFSQGALRSHPWLYREIQAVQDPDQDRGLRAFEEAFDGHIAFVAANVFGSLFHNVTGGLFASAPDHAFDTAGWYKQLARSSRTFALVADMTIALLGGGLKVKQKITGRLADALSELYLLSCVLKRYEDDGQPIQDAKIIEYCARNSLYRFQEAIRGVLDNFPIRWAGWLLRPLVFPLGARRRPASDQLGKEIVRLAMQPGEVRDRLTRDIFITNDVNQPTGLLEVTLVKVIEAEVAEKKLEKGIRDGRVRRYHGRDWIADAAENYVITEEEAKLLKETEALVARVIAVDHFDAAELVPHYQSDKVESAAAAE
ncbi:acyl-coenzyme A dehydrogenase [bacterium MnTg02]|nr:acyl-coenzyme A dehydrogenase [bacterium MnTg02]